MSSFDVTWSSGDKSSMKVFARKRKAKVETQKVASKFTADKPNIEPKTFKFNKEKKGNETTNDKANKLNQANMNNSVETQHKFLKRKERKDIISAKKDLNKVTSNIEKNAGYKPQEKSFNTQQILVKRKQKKDKIAAKKAALENGQTEGNQSNNNIQSKAHSLFSEKYKNVHIQTNIKGKSVVEEVFSDSKKFGDLAIHKFLVSNLEKNNFTALTTVQEKCIPVALKGKNILVRSQTGSGKTLAYAVPILDALQGLNPRVQRSDGVQAIVIVPTRELALQAHELFGKLNTFQWIVVGHLCGGENRKTEKDRLRKGVHILIATPGRLLDHILHTAAFKTNNVRCLVLDEADRLLDMGFKKDIVRIVEEIDNAKTNSEYDPMVMLKRNTSKTFQDLEGPISKEHSPLKNPKSKCRQTFLLSATLTKGITELTEFLMKEHEYIDALDESLPINPEHMVIPNTVQQEFIMTYVKHRLFTLSAMLIAKSKQNSKIFVFMATSHMVDYHYELFTRYLVKMPKNRGKLMSGDVVLLDDALEDIDDDEEVVLDIAFFKLHGNMDQNKRKEVFIGFRKAKRGVLICTDVAARGIDVPSADCIIQYTGPQSDEDYLHRVGRTGRAGKSGSACIFLTHEEQDYITRLQEHKVFLKEQDPKAFLPHLSVLMEEPDQERAAIALQKRYELALSNDKELHRMACLAYSSWSRFYNTYPSKLRSIFDFRKVNLGHYVTSFGLNETPTSVARIVRGQVSNVEPQRLNKKLATHEDERPKKLPQKRKIKSVSLTTSEYSSGLAPVKKKKKKSNYD